MLRRSLISLLLFILLSGFALAHTVGVTQGETVVLSLKVVNSGKQPISGLRAAFEDNPQWLSPAGDSLTVDLPAEIDSAGKPYVLLPFTFTVSRTAPPESSWPVTLRLVDERGNLWTKHISLKVLPDRALLRQNYPNPFNPETWIPYQTTEDGNVNIRIFNSQGRLVRTLDLGRKGPGFYMSRSNAAYWDGRNDAGEEVSSGIYFYHLQAAKLSDVKKMLVLR